MLQLEPNPFGGTLPIRRHWLQVVDRVGGHGSSRGSPRSSSTCSRAGCRSATSTRAAAPRSSTSGFDGGAGAVPLFAGIRGWTGTAKRRLWSYAPPFPMLTHNGHRYRYDFATAALENLAAASTPGLEVHLVQGEARPSEPDCCPSQLLIRNFRFAQGAGRWVLYQTVWRHT